ncbi:type II/IV secretion system protein [Agrobacterium vitis]|uniref:Type II/IV secretion system protein n=1 Tax=Agrobacterium vitis TaxID=373 RepID=A0A368NYE6_AGRVI|nr:GspE/PulE family protein [Agrobacterium vitis]KAA3505435.1 type II/IV secretion system protein [Agrobacterium vitis]KAA3519312.1 type II/IV secretion system protein [Agrobacterium vitis]MCF1480340.1 type II/IV secretion system protein [Agrobacterium vitis]MUZ99709.1 type II/IV secretion system protein [Agrobacterium vitis]MVA32506.1 type II/IV secretion system protein [Agrobacterium vitis]
MAAQAGYDSFFKFLEAEGGLGNESISRLKTVVRTSRLPLDVIITELGVATDVRLVELLSAYLRKPGISLASANEALLADYNLDYARSTGLLPVEVVDNRVVMAMADPLDQGAISLNELYFEKPIDVRAATRKAIQDAVEVLKRETEMPPAAPTIESQAMESDDVARLKDLALEAPIVNLVIQMAQLAYETGSTDIHIEPLSDQIRIRNRVDGVLHIVQTLPKPMLAGLTTRIKILSSLNIAERRIPQDGRMRLSIRGQEVDFRVSTVPSVHGETIVLRLLRHSAGVTTLEGLGYRTADIDRLRKASQSPNGLIIVTGPTGSGKTTTLYALIATLNRPGVKIFTIEDPVEYRMEGITQLQVNQDIGLDFPKALRSVLRQDPDIILVGEIRDRETAQIALQAALTGHLVLTTLHTNDAVGAVTRLQDIGVDPYLISATTKLVIAQRLLRRSCKHLNVVSGESCDRCGGTGYSGRTVAYEIVEIDAELKSMIDRRATEQALRTAVQASGTKSLNAFANDLVEQNVTTRDEVLRVIQQDPTDG